MRLFLTLAVAVALFPGSTAAQQSLMKRNYDKEGKLRIEVVSVFDGALTHGYMPVRVTLRNARPEARDWTLGFDFGGGWNTVEYGSSFRLTGSAGGDTVHDILVPVPASLNHGSNYRQISVRASSPGLNSERSSDSQNFSTQWPEIGISVAISDRNANALDKEVDSRGSLGGADTFGHQYDPKMLPADWRGYTGLDVLMITDGEWGSLSAGAKRAIFEWVRLGGRLDFYTTEDPAAFLKSNALVERVGEGNSNWIAHSLGRVTAVKWDGKSLKPHGAVDRYMSVKNLSQELSKGYMKWGLQAEFGEKSFNPFLVILLLIAFGIIVGPVNLFVLAKPGERQKLFITTPIIALVTSVLIILLILFNDGVGGSGRRMVVANLEAGLEEKRLFITQEQISRAGVLLGTSFQVAEAVFLSPLMLSSSEWNRLHLGRDNIASYTLSGNAYRGDWFQSRSEQGHFLQSVQPTRARIELLEPSPDGEKPPQLFSSLDFTVSEFFYRDDQGHVWRAENESIGGGDKIKLKTASAEELTDWWVDRAKLLSGGLAKKVGKLGEGKGRFFAVSNDSKAGFVEMLDAIDWKQDRALVFGPVVEAEKPATRNKEKAND